MNYLNNIFVKLNTDVQKALKDRNLKKDVKLKKRCCNFTKFV